MSAHSLQWHLLWLASPALLAAVSAVMLRRGLHRDYPLFFLYAIWQVLFSPALFVLDHLSAVTASQFNVLLWIDEVGSMALRFAVIYEIFTALFRPYRPLKQVVGFLTRAGLLGLLIAANAIGGWGPSAGYADRVVGTLFVLNRAVAFIQCGLLVILFVLTWYFNLFWRSYLFGIAAGFGVLSTVQIVTNSLQAESEQPTAINFVIMGAYNICVLIWTVYFLVPERAGRQIRTLPVTDLESWKQELERLLQR
jgi:hypothetical protein